MDGHVHLITFCDKRFSRASNLLYSQAKRLGFSSITKFAPEDISEDFKRVHYETLGFERGAGYWLWKPWIIDSFLKTIAPGDTLLYLDAASLVLREPQYFQQLAEDEKIHTWVENSDFTLNDLWIDPIVWKEVVGSDEPFGTHFMAGAILSRNTQEFRKLIAFWLSLCSKTKYLRPDSIPGYAPSGKLIAHRHDQSLLNCIYILHPQYFRVEYLIGEKEIDPLLVHRFKKVSTLKQLQFFLKCQKLYRIVLLVLPNPLSSSVRGFVSRLRKPYATQDEILRHKRLER